MGNNGAGNSVRTGGKQHAVMAPRAVVMSHCTAALMQCLLNVTSSPLYNTTWGRTKVQAILRPTVSRPVPLGVGPPLGSTTSLNFLFLTITFSLLYVARPLWREDGSVICNAITHRLESCRTHNHILLSHLRLPQPGWPGSRIYTPQVQGGPVIPPGTGFPLRRLLRLAGLRWRDSNLLPQGSRYQVQVQVISATDGQSASLSW
jgi:hypothetical protein